MACFIDGKSNPGPTYEKTIVGSAVFAPMVWQTIGTYSPAQGEAGGINILNGIFWTGTAATVTTSQVSYRVSYRRFTGLPPTVTPGSAGIQGTIASTLFQTIIVGNNIAFQAQFNVAATISWRIPILIQKVIL